MARRDLTGAVDFSVLERATAGADDISDEILGLFVHQASIWGPMLTTAQEGWRDAAHTLRGSAGGIGAGELAELCGTAEGADEAVAEGHLVRVRDALDRALADVAAYRHELALRSLKG
ncbi:Hpt domain-containing protein [uncultured Brevundimonas sp.]|uniref:Hpt domain-containing protein n=1 Tax=uncultured Brevundimonas sp. TaxID=213418 RepID=UPI002619008E|nr:Hpt domain-containing protein [uncultured Brevundimonas sp.]